VVGLPFNPPWFSSHELPSDSLISSDDLGLVRSHGLVAVAADPTLLGVDPTVPYLDQQSESTWVRQKLAPLVSCSHWRRHL
jgi:hypothetical protein